MPLSTPPSRRKAPGASAAGAGAAAAAALLLILSSPPLASAAAVMADDPTANVETESDRLLFEKTSTADDTQATTTTTTTTMHPKSEHATLADVVSFVQTEVPAEFEFGSEFMHGGMTEEDMTSKAKALWDAAVAFEWERCARAEGRSAGGGTGGGGCTFLVCKKDDGGGEGGKKKSGNARRKALMSALERALAVSTGGLITESLKEKAAAITSTFRSVYNGGENDWYCGEGMMKASVAALLSCAEEDGGDGGECTVTPVVMGMTMTPGMVDRMTEALDETYGGGAEGGEFPTVDVTLCSGAVSVSDRVALAVMAAVQDGEIGHLDLRGLDVAVRFIDYVTSASDMMQDVFWSMNNADGGDGGMKNSQRGDFWDALFTDTLGSGLCNEVFEKRIMWSLFDLGYNPGKEDEVVGEVTLALTFDKSSTPTSVDKQCIAALLGALASWSYVCSVDVRPKFTVSNLQAQWLIQSGIQEERPWFDVGLDGTGQVVAVSDTGIDTDNCFFWDANGRPTSVRNDDHRKVVQYVEFVDGVDEQYGHGTHVAATVAGRKAEDGITESTGPADGIARGAKIAFIDIGGQMQALTIPSIPVLLSTGRARMTDNPASIHSGSWGSESQDFYDFRAKMFDDFMYENDDMLVNMAAGNSGSVDRPGSIWSPSRFKNGITVGSSHSFGSDLLPTQLGPAYVSDFSSRGPTSDGRIKPDVVAPGHNLVSAGALPTVIGECDARGLPPPQGAADGLLSLAGTSMATPAVSGTAALIRQYFVEGWYPHGTKGTGEQFSPSGALVKAVILNGARTDMRGVDNGPRGVTPVAPYDNNIGFGRVNLMYALYIEGKSEVQAQVWDRQTIVDSAEREFNVTVDRSGGCTFPDLSVTLVWMEPGAKSACTRCLLNDLDLHLTKDGGDGTIYHPNGLNGRDTKNNAERVVLSNVTDGDTYVLHVTATNLDGPTQRYALVATGCFGGTNSRLDGTDDVFESDGSGTAPPGIFGVSYSILFLVAVGLGTLVVLCAGISFCRHRRRRHKRDENEVLIQRRHDAPVV